MSDSFNTERFETTRMRPLPQGNDTAPEILAYVYRALQGTGNTRDGRVRRRTRKLR